MPKSKIGKNSRTTDKLSNTNRTVQSIIEKLSLSEEIKEQTCLDIMIFISADDPGVNKLFNLELLKTLFTLASTDCAYLVRIAAINALRNLLFHYPTVSITQYMQKNQDSIIDILFLVIDLLSYLVYTLSQKHSLFPFEFHLNSCSSVIDFEQLDLKFNKEFIKSLSITSLEAHIEDILHFIQTITDIASHKILIALADSKKMIYSLTTSIAFSTHQVSAEILETWVGYFTKKVSIQRSCKVSHLFIFFISLSTDSIKYFIKLLNLFADKPNCTIQSLCITFLYLFDYLEIHVATHEFHNYKKLFNFIIINAFQQLYAMLDLFPQSLIQKAIKTAYFEPLLTSEHIDQLKSKSKNELSCAKKNILFVHIIIDIIINKTITSSTFHNILSSIDFYNTIKLQFQVLNDLSVNTNSKVKISNYISDSNNELSDEYIFNKNPLSIFLLNYEFINKIIYLIPSIFEYHRKQRRTDSSKVVKSSYNLPISFLEYKKIYLESFNSHIIDDTCEFLNIRNNIHYFDFVMMEKDYRSYEINFIKLLSKLLIVLPFNVVKQIFCMAVFDNQTGFSSLTEEADLWSILLIFLANKLHDLNDLLNHSIDRVDHLLLIEEILELLQIIQRRAIITAQEMSKLHYKDIFTHPIFNCIQDCDIDLFTRILWNEQLSVQSKIFTLITLGRISELNIIKQQFVNIEQNSIDITPIKENILLTTKLCVAVILHCERQYQSRLKVKYNDSINTMSIEEYVEFSGEAANIIITLFSEDYFDSTIYYALNINTILTSKCLPLFEYILKHKFNRGIQSIIKSIKINTVEFIKYKSKQ